MNVMHSMIVDERALEAVSAERNHLRSFLSYFHVCEILVPRDFGSLKRPNSGPKG